MNQKFENFKKAFLRLKEGVLLFQVNQDDLLRDGLIQRFEFTFELSWKALKVYFESEGLVGLNSPKSVLKEAYAQQLIVNEEFWLNMLHDRNLTTHIYDESVANQICSRILTQYIDLFDFLISKLNMIYSKI